MLHWSLHGFHLQPTLRSPGSCFEFFELQLLRNGRIGFYDVKPMRVGGCHNNKTYKQQVHLINIRLFWHTDDEYQSCPETPNMDVSTCWKHSRLPQRFQHDSFWLHKLNCFCADRTVKILKIHHFLPLRPFMLDTDGRNPAPPCIKHQPQLASRISSINCFQSQGTFWYLQSKQ